MKDEKTAFLHLPLPHEENMLEDDCPRIREALTMLDSNAQGQAATIDEHGTQLNRLGQGLNGLGEAVSNEVLPALQGVQQAQQAFAQQYAVDMENAASATQAAQQAAENAASTAATAMDNHDASENAHSAAFAHMLCGQTSPVFGFIRLEKGHGAGLWANLGAEGEVLTLTQQYFDRHPLYMGMEKQVIDSQHMNRVPKFYVKHGVKDVGSGYTNCPYTLISPDKVDESWHLHPAFMNAGQEIGQFWLGCYEAAVDPTNSGKAASLPALNALVSINFDTGIARCNARNVGGVQGFMMQDVWQWAALRMLFLAEMGTPDGQAKLGRGLVDLGSSSSYIGGTTDDMRGHKPWRGFHHLWGSVWEMVNGIRTNGSNLLDIFKNDGSRQYVNTGLAMCNTGGWITDTMRQTGNGFDLADTFVPSASDAAETNGSYGDYVWRNGANCVCYTSARWSYGSNAGAFCLYLDNPASSSSVTIGLRLAKV